MQTNGAFFHLFYLIRAGFIPIELLNKCIVKSVQLSGRTGKMGVYNQLENVIYVELPSEGQQISDELKALNEDVSTRNDCDVIVDFSKVEIVNSSNISNLLILRGLLQDKGRRLILCDVRTVTKCIFVVAGLAEIFVFADDKCAALAEVKNSD